MRQSDGGPRWRAVDQVRLRAMKPRESGRRTRGPQCHSEAESTQIEVHAATPEPGSVVLLGTVLLTFLWRLRRRLTNPRRAAPRLLYPLAHARYPILSAAAARSLRITSPHRWARLQPARIALLRELPPNRNRPPIQLIHSLEDFQLQILVDGRRSQVCVRLSLSHFQEGTHAGRAPLAPAPTRNQRARPWSLVQLSSHLHSDSISRRLKA